MLDAHTRVIQFRPVPEHCFLLSFGQSCEHYLQARICVNRSSCRLPCSSCRLPCIALTLLGVSWVLELVVFRLQTLVLFALLVLLALLHTSTMVLRMLH